MIVPVIALSQEQVEQVAGLLGEARSLKGQVEALEEQKTEKEQEIDQFLRNIALAESERYKDGEEERRDSSRIDDGSRLIPTLSEDGRSVVILTQKSRGC